MPNFNVSLKILKYIEKKTHNLFTKLYQRKMKLQTKIQITQQDDKSK